MTFLGNTKDFLLHLDASEAIFKKAHFLRHPMTHSEKILWNQLKNRKLNGLKFRRQHPIRFYIADFYCHELRLVIEVDGGIHKKSEVKEHDENRTAELERLGITVLRFTNEQITNKLDEALKEIASYSLTLNRLSSPSPSGEGAGG